MKELNLLTGKMYTLWISKYCKLRRCFKKFYQHNENQHSKNHFSGPFEFFFFLLQGEFGESEILTLAKRRGFQPGSKIIKLGNQLQDINSCCFNHQRDGQFLQSGRWTKRHGLGSPFTLHQFSGEELSFSLDALALQAADNLWQTGTPALSPRIPLPRRKHTGFNRY